MLWLTIIQGHKWLTLHWHSFSWLGRVRVAFFLAYKWGQYIQYVLKSPRLWPITWLTSPTTIDTLLTRSFRIRQIAHRFLWSHDRQPVCHLCISATNRHPEWTYWKATHCWCTVDAHFLNEAGSVSLHLLLINAAYIWFMNIWIQLPLSLPKMHDQKSFNCRWQSFSWWGRELVSLAFDYKGSQYIRKGQRYSNVNILWLAIWYLNVTIHKNNPKTECGN
jgi:hypothetical protein